MPDFKKLKVWQKAHALALSAHAAATSIRGPAYANLRNQIIRSASSVPTNIAEGREQTSDAGFARYLRIAIASISELESHFLAARDFAVIQNEQFEACVGQLREVRMMLYGLVRRLDGPTDP